MEATMPGATLGAPAKPSSTPIWYWVVATLGLLWSAFGALQFIIAVSSTPEDLVAGGMTPEQAAVMSGYPGWMTAAFAVGVFGGVLGCVLLLMRNKTSTAVLAVSLAAYVVLYIGDYTEGVFAAMGAPQVIVLSLVVLIAAGLVWVSRLRF